jgi:hypothetical protein
LYENSIGRVRARHFELAAALVAVLEPLTGVPLAYFRNHATAMRYKMARFSSGVTNVVSGHQRGIVTVKVSYFDEMEIPRNRGLAQPLKRSFRLPRLIA